jgi:hypothetical protein
MRKFILFLFFLLFVFTGAFSASRWLRLREKREEGFEPLSLTQARFSPHPYPLQDHPFTVVVTGRNNGASVEKTLSSIFAQHYGNYRVIYIDDASDDGCYEVVKDLVADSSQRDRVTLIQNTHPLGSLANLKRAIDSCLDHEIIVVVDGRDALAHEWVLERLNAYYADPDLWITYGQYLEYPTFQIGNCQLFNDEEPRAKRFVPCHLKSFYAGLFKKIESRDLTYQGHFLEEEEGMTYLLPLMEMAKNHVQFIPEVLYVLNRRENQEREPEAQSWSERLIRSFPPYQSLKSLELIPKEETFE